MILQMPLDLDSGETESTKEKVREDKYRSKRSKRGLNSQLKPRMKPTPRGKDDRSSTAPAARHRPRFKFGETRNSSNQDSETSPKYHPNQLKSDPNIIPKWNQQWSRNGPVRGIRHQQIPENELCDFGSPQSSKTDPNNYPQIRKKQVVEHFFSTHIKHDFPGVVFLVFDPTTSQTHKIGPKRYNGVQKRGCHLSMKQKITTNVKT